MTSQSAIVPVAEADWLKLRRLRLEMLQDRPIAYGETLSQAIALADDEWRWRARRCQQTSSIGLAAVEAGDRSVATVSAYVGPAQVANLVGLHVAPNHRGTGLADQLVQA